MRYSSLAFIAAIAVALPVLAEELPIQPDNSLTPGVIGSADFADVCGLVDGQTYSQRHRDTTQKMKNAAYVAYNVNKAGREFEVDHRVPLCIGGADDQANLWPQLGFEHPSFHDKDRLETRVCGAVCRTRTMTLAEGQAIFLGDWIAGYEQIYGEPPE